MTDKINTKYYDDNILSFLTDKEKFRIETKELFTFISENIVKKIGLEEEQAIEVTTIAFSEILDGVKYNPAIFAKESFTNKLFSELNEILIDYIDYNRSSGVLVNFFNSFSFIENWHNLDNNQKSIYLYHKVYDIPKENIAKAVNLSVNTIDDLLLAAEQKIE